MNLKKTKSAYKPIEGLYTLKAIYLFRIMFGNYYIVSSSKLICLAIRLYCICVISLTFYILVEQISTIFILLEYVLNIIISWTYNEQFLLRYFTAVKTCDAIMGYKNIPIVPNYFYFIVYAIVILRTTNNIVGCIIGKTVSWAHYFLRFGILLNADLSYLSPIIIFSMLHYRFMLLKQFCEKNLIISVNISRNENIIGSIRNIKKSLYNYNHLLDNILNVNRQMQYMVIFK